ncbi:RNA ligase [Leisingera caerulea]|uniref:RNA ligase n=1 Tax=Leisingera caerulea TaxID=506591 RepID=UPI000482F311|nr:RNA ligase [Leisingera caerulea]
MARKVIFIRGPQGAGKSTLMRRAGLEGFNISMDKIRNVLGGDMLNPDGQFVPNHEYEPLAFDVFQDSMKRRIARGEVVCIDGTLANGSQLYEHWSQFEQGGYSGLVIDLYGFDDTLRMQRNMARPERERVPESSVARMKAMADEVPMPPVMRENPKVEFFNPTDDDGIDAALAEIGRFLADPRCSRDLSRYDRVVHIGDIQGCHAPLLDPRSPLKDGLDPRTFYIFHGDLFDRGVQNGEVGKWFMQEVYGRPNAVLIAGNHEDYVEHQARAGKGDIGLPDSEWARFSWPQLKEAGLTHRDCRRIAEMSQDYLAYSWRGREVLCSHAGFARWPSNMDLVSTHQLRRGNGRYEVDVDTEWSANEAGTGRVQVHGHRNSAMQPSTAAPLSINLEGQVEFGGHLRFLKLDDAGFTPINIRSAVHRTMQDDIAANRAVNRTPASRHAPLMPWIQRGEALPKVSSGLVSKLRNHDMINIKPSGSLPGVFSVNFTHKAFNNAAWDDYTTMARGLYIDGEIGTVVARSYEKFFNLNERPETQADTIGDRLTFPVDAFEKANGFLCITGFSERLGELVVASKSVTDGDFPDIARDVLATALGPAGMERLLRFNRDQQASLVFEIEDPERDPHIIKLDRPTVTLLACIRRSETFEQAPYKDLQKVAKWLGCDVKNRIASLPNKRALESFNRRVEHDPKWMINGAPVEGCVMEDASGQFYKLKSHFYRNWKRMRGAVNHIRKAKLAGKEASMERYADMEEPYQEFMAWAKTLPFPALEKDIITLRDAFNGDRSEMENIRDTRTESLAAAQAAERAAHFSGLIDKIADNEKISTDGLARFVLGAMDDPEKAEVLRGHDRYAELIERAELEAAPVPGL